MTNEQKSWKERLKAIGISQAEFSRILNNNIKKPVLCDYMNCKHEPLASTYQNIEETLKRLEGKYKR